MVHGDDVIGDAERVERRDEQADLVEKDRGRGVGSGPEPPERGFLEGHDFWIPVGDLRSQKPGAPFEVARLKLGKGEIHGSRHVDRDRPGERRDDVRLVRAVIHVLGHDLDRHIRVGVSRRRQTGHGKAESREDHEFTKHGLPP